MIRRTPTLIQMTDMDVQDVRDMVALQKAEAISRQNALLKIKQLAETPTIQDEDLAFMKTMRNRKQDRDVRLGLTPATS
ncbi:hypothetical protein C8J56DRAFT_926390 [Mycena floridula]|nr:hypothetical protein C8J56DRAFT_926390 [Mycena floridula]